MNMHSSKFKDPLISRAQPVTVITPLVEETLRNAGVTPNRDLILDLFMNGQPRIAVIHGGDDHPPNIGMKETIRRVIRFIWASEALPFEVSQNIPCEELAHGTEGASYALLSRNICAALDSVAAPPYMILIPIPASRRLSASRGGITKAFAKIFDLKNRIHEA